LPFEVANVVRRKWSQGLLTKAAAEAALTTLRQLPITLWPWEVLSETIWRLRGGLTGYDAAYVALAGLTKATLVTGDKAMARHGHGLVEVHLVAA
jgi:predicted nucleic acid-binding protein